MRQSVPWSQRISIWLALSRAPFLSVGFLPFLLGVVIAWSEGNPLRWGVFFLSLLAVILIMLTTYYAGEYYDYASDFLNREYNRFSGGSRVIPAGLVPRHYPLVASYVSLGLAIILGLILQFYYQTGPYTIPLGAFGLLCGFFYSSKPLQWAYRGVGEILIGVCYGWLTVNAAYYLQTGHFSALATLVSLPIALTIFLVILINEFPDIGADMMVGKRTLVVRFGREAMANLYMVILAVSFGAILIGLPFGVPGLVGILSPLVLLLVIGNIRAIRGRGYEDSEVLEKLCGRTILINLLISGIYLVAFAVEGWL
jgi:1,4-dihydroxy-2-naphthoate octaprenyltransferase